MLCRVQGELKMESHMENVRLNEMETGVWDVKVSGAKDVC